MQHMIEPVIFMGTLNRSNILGTFHDADSCAVALGIAANAANRLLGEILADGAVVYMLLGAQNGFGKCRCILLRHLHDRIRKALRGFHADARQRSEFFGEHDKRQRAEIIHRSEQPRKCDAAGDLGHLVLGGLLDVVDRLIDCADDEIL